MSFYMSMTYRKENIEKGEKKVKTDPVKYIQSLDAISFKVIVLVNKLIFVFTKHALNWLNVTKKFFLTLIK